MHYKKVISFYISQMIIMLYPVHWLILFLLRSVFRCFHLNYCSWYVIGCFYKKGLPCMIVKWLSFYIQFIDWFCTCLDLYGVSFHFNYYSPYGYCYFIRSDLFVWVLNDQYLISSLLTDWFFSSLDLFFVPFHLVHIEVGMFVAALQ